MSRFSSITRMFVLGAVSLVAVTGCASGGGEGSATPSNIVQGVVGDQGDAGAPVSGGTLNFASYSSVTGLDPTKVQATGATGGTELAAVYDVLMRYDSDQKEFVPQLAKSIEESPDALSWTLTLRDNVKFSDGTALDAAAVVASIERYNTMRGANSQLFQKLVQSTVAKDPSTVVFTLNQPWHSFPSLLSYGHGMIVAASADAGEKFTPVGAGAFAFESLVPQQELKLTARPDYWGGKPPLDALHFVAITGEQAKIETMRSGGLDMAYLRNAETVMQARAEFPGYVETTSMSQVGQLNSAPGRPGSNPLVRQAIAYAVDPVVIDQRARGGQGMPGTDMFQPWSVWHSDTVGITPDAERARTLLDQAKAEGYDGKLSFIAVSDPDAQALALSVQAQMNSVGFEVTIDTVASVTDMIKRQYVDRDFDLSAGGNGTSEVVPEIRLFSGLDSKSTNNAVGYVSPQMDDLLGKLFSAPDDDAKRATIADIQNLMNTDQALLVWGASAAFVPWSPKVFGAEPTLDGMILLDKAFKK